MGSGRDAAGSESDSDSEEPMGVIPRPLGVIWRPQALEVIWKFLRMICWPLDEKATGSDLKGY